MIEEIVKKFQEELNNPITDKRDYLALQALDRIKKVSKDSSDKFDKYLKYLEGEKNFDLDRVSKTLKTLSAFNFTTYNGLIKQLENYEKLFSK